MAHMNDEESNRLHLEPQKRATLEYPKRKLEENFKLHKKLESNV